MKRIAVNLTEYESRCIEALIREYYAEHGINLSKSQFIRKHIAPSLRIARDFLDIKEEEQ